MKKALTVGFLLFTLGCEKDAPQSKASSPDSVQSVIESVQKLEDSLKKGVVVEVKPVQSRGY